MGCVLPPQFMTARSMNLGILAMMFHLRSGCGNGVLRVIMASITIWQELSKSSVADIGTAVWGATGDIR